MRIETLNLPPAAHNHSKVHDSKKEFPGVPSGNTNEVATTKRPTTENLAATGTTVAEQAAKSAPNGLENAITKLEVKDNKGKGIERALEMLTRNLASHTTTPEPAETGSTATATDGSSTI